MKKYILPSWIAFLIPFLILCGVILVNFIMIPTKPKIIHPTFTQHQQLELRVERLEKIVGLRGEEMRKEGLQNKIE